MYPAFRAASQKMRSGSEAGSLALRDAKVRGFESLRAIFCVRSGKEVSSGCIGVLKTALLFVILALKSESGGQSARKTTAVPLPEKRLRRPVPAKIKITVITII